MMVAMVVMVLMVWVGGRESDGDDGGGDRGGDHGGGSPIRVLNVKMEAMIW